MGSALVGTEEHHLGLVVVTHTPEATDRFYPWVRRNEPQPGREAAPPVVVPASQRLPVSAELSFGMYR